MKYSREEITSVCYIGIIQDKFGDSGKPCGTFMTYEEFMEDVNRGCLMDYDGYGELVLYGNGVVLNSHTDIDAGVMHIGQSLSIPFEELYDIFGDDMKIWWFNR